MEPVPICAKPVGADTARAATTNKVREKILVLAILFRSSIPWLLIRDLQGRQIPATLYSITAPNSRANENQFRPTRKKVVS